MRRHWKQFSFGQLLGTVDAVRFIEYKKKFNNAEIAVAFNLVLSKRSNEIMQTNQQFECSTTLSLIEIWCSAR